MFGNLPHCNCSEGPLKNSNEYLKESILMKYKPMKQIMLKIIFVRWDVCVCARTHEPIYSINSASLRPAQHNVYHTDSSFTDENF